MNEYVTACRAAHAAGTDFMQCNVHSGQALPLLVMSDCINEKLKCTFSGSELLKVSETV